MATHNDVETLMLSEKRVHIPQCPINKVHKEQNQNHVLSKVFIKIFKLI